MGVIGDILKSLFSALCGGSNQQQDQQQQQQQSGQKPYGQQQQQQQQQPYDQQQPSPQQQQQQPYSQAEYPPLSQQQQQQPAQAPPQQGWQQAPHHGQPHGQSNGQPHSQPHGQSHGQPQQQPQHPSSPPPKPHYQGGQDQNQANQHDAHYMGLRAQANQEGDAMARAYEQSHEAYARGDGAGAKQLSNEGHAHKDKMESLNKQASDWIFVENNKDSKPGEIDLHGLYVKEAISHTDQAIVQAKQRGDADIHLIVGKGIHSQGGHAKIKPAIEELMQKHQLVAELDPHNAGVLIVRLDGQGQGMNPDEVSRRLDSNQDCVIM